MNELAVYWASELARATAALAVSALVVAGAMRLLRISSPRACRAAYCLVLVQGWLVVHPRIELPWGEPPAAESASVVAAREPQAPKHAETSARRVVEAAGPREELPIATSAEADAPVSPQAPAIAEVMSLRAARDPRGGGWLAAIATGLLLVWAAGMLAAATALAISYWRFLREIGVSRPLAPEWLDEWRQALAEQGGMQRIELLVTANVGPLICCTPRGRRVLVPEELWRELNSVQRLAVLRHELAHCRRGDLWKSFAVRLLAAPHWFNPFAWRAVRRFDEAAEWACDALAQRTEEERLEYAKALLRLCHCHASRRSLAAAAGGRRITARLERILSPQCKADSLINKAALAVCGAALLFAAWVRVELVVRAAEPTASTEVDDGASSAPRPQQDKPADAKAEDPKADDAPPAERKAPTEIDASFLEMLARREAKFSACRVEYVTWEDKGEMPPAEEQRIEFARDGRGRWFRKEGRFTAGVRANQYDLFAEQDGRRVIFVSQHNWNGLNPPQVQIQKPRPESQRGYDALPLQGLFPLNKPLSASLKDQEVRVEIVDGDAVLHWKYAIAQATFHYEVQLSTEHDFTPVRFKHALEGGYYSEWRATQLKQADGVWYPTEGELFTFAKALQRYVFKTTRFELGKPLPEAAMRYEIPDGAWVFDQISGQRYTQGRAATHKTKPLKVTIRDVADQPVAGAKIKITLHRSSREEAGQEPIELLTDAEGIADFKAVPDTPLFLQASKEGMRPSSIILGDGQELKLYLTPRTWGTVVDAQGEKLHSGSVYTVNQSLEFTQGLIKWLPSRSRDVAEIGADGTYDFTQDLTLRRLGDPLMLVAFAGEGRQMAIRAVMPRDLVRPVDFVVEPAALITAELRLPPGAPATTKIEVSWTDASGRRIAHSSAPVEVDAADGSLSAKPLGRFPPGSYQMRIGRSEEIESAVVDFVVRPKQTEVALGVIPLRPSTFAALRGRSAPELSATPMAPSELKPFSELRGQIVALNFWRWGGEKLNDHPEQTPFFTLQARYKGQPVYWIAIHSHRVLDSDALAAKVVGMRKTLWGEGPAPFASLIDQSEPAPPVEDASARTAVAGFVPGPTRDVTRTRYGIAYRRLVLIDRQGRVEGCYSEEELEPALKRLLEAEK